MKALLFLLLAALAAPQTPEKISPETYISTYSELAVSEMARTGVPASISLAQGMLESDFGNSRLALEGKNHFGIKCHNDWMGARVFQDDDAANECFRVYVRVEDSFADHSDFLRGGKRYASLFNLDPKDYKAWAKGLQKSGYATSKKYAKSLTELIERYELYRFDSEAAGSTPAPPALDATDGQPEAAEALATESKSVPDEVPAETFRFRAGREVMKLNGVRCIRTIKGETYTSIARTYNLFDKELLFFNDLGEAEELEPGSLVFLGLKRSIAPRGYYIHTVAEGDGRLRDICQKYGVRVSAIRRINKFSKTYEPSTGDTIYLRR